MVVTHRVVPVVGETSSFLHQQCRIRVPKILSTSVNKYLVGVQMGGYLIKNIKHLTVNTQVGVGCKKRGEPVEGQR